MKRFLFRSGDRVTVAYAEPGLEWTQDEPGEVLLTMPEDGAVAVRLDHGGLAPWFFRPAQLDHE